MKPARRPLRIALIAIAAIIVIGVGAVAVLLGRFDPNAYKPQIVQAVKRATGRDLALNGTINLKPSLWPTIQVADVAFSNPPGFSRPHMATLKGLEVQLALLPLISSRIEIDRLVLIHPDILLETDAAGRPNWQMTPEAPPPTAATQPGAPSVKAPPAISVGSIRIEDGTLGYRDAAKGQLTTLKLTRVDAAAASADSPLHLEADASYNATPFNLIADTGSLARLQDRAATSPWPLKLALTTAGARLLADGSMTKPLQGKGYDLAVDGTVADATALAPLLGGYAPPPLRDVSFAAKIADKGGTLPEFSTLTLHVGATDLSAQMPGLALTRLDVDAPKVDQPVKVQAVAKLGDAPLAMAGIFGPPAQWLPDAKPAPYAVDVTVQAAGAAATAKGSIADVKALTGADLAIAGQIPDLAALSSLAGRPLPPVKTIAFQGALNGNRQTFGLHAFSLTSSAGDLSGEAAVGLGARRVLNAVLKSSRIDLDALQAASGQPALAAAAPTTVTPSPKQRQERLFSDQPLPFAMLRDVDADLTLAVADLRSGGADYKAINTHALLKGGKLVVDPFAADLPGGHLAGTVTVDASQSEPPVHVVLHAPGLALKSVLEALHEPPYANGNLEVYADLHGKGDTQHAIASSLDGSLGLAIPNGTIDNRLLGNLLGKVMDTLNALNLVGKGGTSDLRCFGLRMDAENGVGTFKALTLSSSLLTLTGSGSVNLGAETLAMGLRPQGRVAGTGVVIPVAVSGPIRNPAVKVNEIGAAEANAGSVAGAVIGNATPLGIVGGLLGGDKLTGGGTTDICTPALAAARGQPVADTAAPAKPAANNVGSTTPGSVNPGAQLKNLFR